MVFIATIVSYPFKNAIGVVKTNIKNTNDLVIHRPFDSVGDYNPHDYFMVFIS